MGIGLTAEHEELAASVRAFAARHVPREAVRAAIEGDAGRRPDHWRALAGQGLLGLHLPEGHGGQGFSLVELAVAVEEMGRALAPDPYVPTVLTSAVLLAAGAGEFLPGLAEGTRCGAVSLAGGLTGRRDGAALVVEGTVEPVLGGLTADLFVLPVETAEGEEWITVSASEVTVEPLESLDPVRRVARVSLSEVSAEQVLTGLTRPDVRAIAAVILGAEACGVAGWAVDTAATYARTREQFGRPIGQFQGIKHKCARMLVELERARAAVWDAAHAVSRDAGDQVAYAAGVAAALAPDTAVAATQDCIQVHGGIGYTFEHDATGRALTLRALLGRASEWHASVAALALSGVTRHHELDLPAEAEPLRREINEQVTALAALGGRDRVAALADGGWVQPYLPRPWGRAAAPLEQVIIHQELRAASVRPPALMIGAWVAPSLATHGTPEQQERFLPPTLRGEIVWCQLFSEPGAGSDLAGLRTRAERVEGGWRISGQKIWTSLAQHAQWGICVARTDPDAPKHKGITYFLVDMASPGIDVRPLTELTGEQIFNEVFLDEVFVPDAMVVGEVDSGWKVARGTLTAERVNLSTGWQLGADVPGLLKLAEDLGVAADPVVRDALGRLAADAHVFALLGVRATLKQLSGVDVGATANVGKLVGMEHGQRVTEYGFGLLGAEGALTGRRADGPRRHWTRLLLASRAMTIGGGTTEVNLNVIGERLLGLPRDP
jgi:alkylation response protein AidB-like acyl-CoA dehydrogenase